MSYSSGPVTAVAENLGVTSNMIYRWRQKNTHLTAIRRSLHSSRTSSANSTEGSPTWKRKITY